jgi:hypothetical protein
MNDTLKGFEPIDPGRVNPGDPIEMNYWCDQFGCDLPQLNAAIARAGEHVSDLRQDLKRAGIPSQ